MLVRRYWLDAEGRPHREEVTLVAAPPGAPTVTPVGPVELEGETIADRPLAVLAIVDPAVGPDAIAGQPHVVYEAELPQGHRLVSREEWEEVTAAATARRDADLATYEATLAEREATRRSALTKLAEAAGLTPEELAALTGSAS